MTIDIIAKSVLTFIQQDYKNSVIAGGAIRDTYLEIEPKDWDIFVPVCGKKNIQKLIDKVHKEFSPPVTNSETHHYEINHLVNSVNYLELEGKKIEIIGRNEPDDEDFPIEVIGDFDFGVNMAYFDGRSFDYDNEHFDTDMRNGYISLINLKEMYGLPKAMRRFERINKKFEDNGKGKWEFRAPCLSLKNEKVKTKRNPYDFINDSFAPRDNQPAVAHEMPAGRLTARNPPAHPVQEQEDDGNRRREEQEHLAERLRQLRGQLQFDQAQAQFNQALDNNF